MSIIINALRQGHKELALALIQHAKPYQVCLYDQQGQTALHLAVQKNLPDVVNALLEKGANINALATDPSYTHMTPLHYAALTGNLKLTQLLLAWGANIHLENGQFHTPATMAYQHGFLEVARMIEQRHRHAVKYQWPQHLPILPNKQTKELVPRRMMELQKSAIENAEARNWYNQQSATMNNVVDFMAYRKKKMK